MPQNASADLDALHQRNEEFENYFANTIIPQLFIDDDLILRKFTPPAMTHFQLSKENIGKEIGAVKDNIKYPTIVENIQEVIDTGEILEKEIQTIDGKWFQMNILPYKVRKENRTNGVIITFVDISQRIQTLRDLEKLNAEHETLRFALSHDIKQPLTTLSLLQNMLEQAFDTKNRSVFQRCLQKFRTALKNLRTLVDSFFEAHKSETEWVKGMERINIESVIDDITTALKAENFANRNYTTNFQTSEILFSRNNLRSIVFNLLNNAIKYKHPDRQLQVNISTKKVEDFILFQVQDNGMGIASDDQEKIFRKGQRLHSQEEGTGMGLYIVKRMLESMGSRIRVESELGKGSTFSVYFKENRS